MVTLLLVLGGWFLLSLAFCALWAFVGWRRNDSPTLVPKVGRIRVPAPRRAVGASN